MFLDSLAGDSTVFSNTTIVLHLGVDEGIWIRDLLFASADHIEGIDKVALERWQNNPEFLEWAESRMGTQVERVCVCVQITSQ